MSNNVKISEALLKGSGLAKKKIPPAVVSKPSFTKYDPGSGVVAMTADTRQPIYTKEHLVKTARDSLDDVQPGNLYMVKTLDDRPGVPLPAPIAKGIQKKNVDTFTGSLEQYPPGMMFKETNRGTLQPVWTEKTYNAYTQTEAYKQTVAATTEREYQTYKKEDAFRSWGKIFVGSLNDPISFMGEFGELVYGKITGDQNASKHFFTDYYQKAVAKQRQAVTSPLDFVMYNFESPFVSIPITVSGIEGLGYLKGLGPTGAKISSGISKALGLYSAKSIYEGGVEAFKAGTLPDYVFRQGVYLGATMVAGRSAFKRGETLGIRKRIISQASTPMEKARLRFLFETIDKTSYLPSKQARVFDISQTGSLKGNTAQQQALTRFMTESPYAKKLVLGGSASQSTYLKSGRVPQDIDILVRKTLFGKSRVADVTTSMKKYGVDISLYDIHDMPSLGSGFVQRGTGFSERPIKTPGGSLFKYQMRFSEQAGRKFASAYSPLHELRGKDWADVLNISKEYLSPKTTALLEKYQPMLKPGTYELIGESYYGKNPQLAPETRFTFFEKTLRKYSSGVTQSELFTPEGQGFMKPGAAPFRPHLINKPVVPSWAKGIVLFSVAVPSGIGVSSQTGNLLGLSLFPGSISSTKKKTDSSYPITYQKTSNYIKSPVSPYKSNITDYVFPLYPRGTQPYKPPVKDNYRGVSPYRDTKLYSVTTKTPSPSIIFSKSEKYAYSPSVKEKDIYPVLKPNKYFFDELMMKPHKKYDKLDWGKGYRFRKWKVPSVESLFPDMPKIKIKRRSISW